MCHNFSSPILWLLLCFLYSLSQTPPLTRHIIFTVSPWWKMHVFIPVISFFTARPSSSHSRCPIISLVRSVHSKTNSYTFPRNCFSLLSLCFILSNFANVLSIYGVFRAPFFPVREWIAATSLSLFTRVPVVGECLANLLRLRPTTF